MEEIKTTEEIIIQKIAMDVQEEFQMGGLADALHFNFASEVAKRYADLAVSKERERILEVIKSAKAYVVKIPEIDPSFGDLIDADLNFIEHKEGNVLFRHELINLINTK